MTDGPTRTYTLPRDGEPYLSFTGRLMAEVSTERPGSDHWVELRAYRLPDGRLVGEEVRRSDRQNQRDHHKAAVLLDERELVSFFGRGPLAQELYEIAKVQDTEHVDDGFTGEVANSREALRRCNDLLRRAGVVLNGMASVSDGLQGDDWGREFRSFEPCSQERFLMLAAFEVSRETSDLPPEVDDFGSWLITRSRFRSAATRLRLLYLQAEARFPDLARVMESLWESVEGGADGLEAWLREHEG